MCKLTAVPMLISISVIINLLRIIIEIVKENHSKSKACTLVRERTAL